MRWSAHVKISGTPEPKGSTSAFRIGNRIVVTSANKRLKPWAALVMRMAVVHAPPQPIDGPCAVALRFTVARPKTVKRVWPTARPDLDKLTRAVLDALTKARWWVDDAMVVNINAIKEFGVPGVEIFATEMETQ